MSPPARLTEWLDIDYPIIGAPMFLVSYEEYAVAVSQSGALGAVPLPNYRTIEDLRRALQAIRGGTDRPFGVNIHLSGRFPWKEQLALCLDSGVDFFIASLGNPGLITDDVHANGGIVFADVISLSQALKSRDRGADGLIAVAAGAGGHCGTLPVMVLVPYLIEKTDLPVVAAGGISSGRQMAAAMALGASGVVIGTRLIASKETRASPAYKQAVIDAGPEDVITTDEITGNPATWLAQSVAAFKERPELRSQRWRDLWSAGLSVAQTDTLRPAGEIIKDIVTEYEETCHELAASLAQ